MTLSRVRQHGALFLDAAGGQLMLRGLNLGGDSKVPWPDGGTERPSDFANHRDVSFVGRPFPLDEADEHLGRIARWGFNTLRMLTTWEAVEHSGPGLYDREYLDDFTEVCRRAGEHGLYLFVDFHQDAWSRMSGGDGAPGWTFEAVGLDFARFPAADAAHVMQAAYDYASQERRQAAYPQMSWGSNYRLPANGIMWTLFWGGRLFTPEFRVEGANVQAFLQSRYLGAMDQVARRLAAMDHVLGFDTLNEPSLGWFGAPLSYRHLARSADHPAPPRIGPALSPLDALAMAQGAPVTVPVLARNGDGAAVPNGTRTFNASRVRIWKDGADCPFERAGVYRMDGDTPTPLREDAFQRAGAGRLSASEDAFAPFFHNVAKTVRARQDAWSVFAEMDVFARLSGRSFSADLPERTVNAGHWYDLALLYLKSLEVDRGGEPAGASYRRELGELAAEAEVVPGGAPTLVGEFGIPYDLDGGSAFERWAKGERQGVWAEHVRALGAMYDVLDALLLHATQWNYTASNRNDLRIGDRWNQEDLSVFSRDQQDDPADPESGGRAVEGFSRPFVRRTQGRLRSMQFDRSRRVFRADYLADAAITGATEVFLAPLQYPDGCTIRLEGAPGDITRSPDGRVVKIRALASGPASLTVEPANRSGG